MESNIANGSVRVKDGNVILQLLVLPWLRSRLCKMRWLGLFHCLIPQVFSPKRNRNFEVLERSPEVESEHRRCVLDVCGSTRL